MKLYSYDVWDTLIKRNCHPTYTIQLSIYFLLLNSRIILNYNELYLNVMKTERILYSEKKQYDLGTVIIDELYKINPSLSIADYSNLKKTWEKIYFKIEKSVTYPNREVIDMLHNDNGYKIYISDFYTNKNFLDSLLSHHHITLDDGYVSLDLNASKYTGTIYSMVRNNVNEKIKYTSWIHTGDNKLSDIVEAKKQGINVRYIKNKYKKIKTKYYSDSEKVAIIMAGFCKFLNEQASNNNVNKIFFFTREGIFFKDLFDIFHNNMLFIDKKNITSQLLPVSRISTLALRLSPDKEYLGFSDAVIQYGNGLSSFLSFFNLLELESEFEKKYETIDQLLENPDTFDYNLLFDAISSKKKSAELFLKENNIDTDSIIVDIGWRGSIQDNIKNIPSNKIKAGCYLGLSKYLDGQNSKGKVSYIFDQNSSFIKYNDKALGFWEMLFNGPGGSVIGYLDGIPEHKINEQEEKNLLSVLKFQKQIKYDFKKIICNINKGKLDFLSIDSLSKEYYYEISKKPSSFLADLYINTIHNESYGLGKFKINSVNIKMQSLAKSFFSNSQRKAISDSISSNGWRESLIYSSETSLITKLAALIIK